MRDRAVNHVLILSPDYDLTRHRDRVALFVPNRRPRLIAIIERDRNRRLRDPGLALFIYQFLQRRTSYLLSFIKARARSKKCEHIATRCIHVNIERARARESERETSLQKRLNQSSKHEHASNILTITSSRIKDSLSSPSSSSLISRSREREREGKQGRKISKIRNHIQQLF